MDKFISLGFLPHSMLLGKKLPTVKNSARNKTSSSNYRAVINSTNHHKMFEYLTLPHLEKDSIVSRHQFAYRPSTGGLKAITLLKTFRCALRHDWSFTGIWPIKYKHSLHYIKENWTTWRNYQYNWICMWKYFRWHGLWWRAKWILAGRKSNEARRFNVRIFTHILYKWSVRHYNKSPSRLPSKL